MKINKTGLDVARGFLRGATKGGLVGGAASGATGAAIIVTTPAWLPLIGGAMAVSAATVAIWGTTGAGVGAAVGGTVEYARAKKRDKDFEKYFGKGNGS